MRSKQIRDLIVLMEQYRDSIKTSLTTYKSELERLNIEYIKTQSYLAQLIDAKDELPNEEQNDEYNQ